MEISSFNVLSTISRTATLWAASARSCVTSALYAFLSRTYLIKIGLLKSRVIKGGSGWDLLTTDVAAYFTKQLEAYCRAISTALPSEQASRMNSLLKSAFDEKLKWA